MATQDGVLSPTITGIDASTFVARVKAEIHRDRQVDEDAILREMCSALDWYKSHRFWFNTARFNLYTVEGRNEYQQATGWPRPQAQLPPNLLRIDHVRITVNSSTYPLRRMNYQYVRDMDTATNVNGYPEIYAIRNNKLLLYPSPNADDLTLPIDYVLDTGTPQCLYTNGNWRLSDKNGTAVGLTWTSKMLQNCEELIRHRTKAGLYANIIIDIDRANSSRVQEEEALENLTGRSEWLNDPGPVIPWY